MVPPPAPLASLSAATAPVAANMLAVVAKSARLPIRIVIVIAFLFILG